MSNYLSATFRLRGCDVVHHPHAPFEISLEGVEPSTMRAFLAFKRAMMLHRRLMIAALADEQVRPAQAGCLQVLAHRGGMSQSDLAEVLHVSRPTVTAMLQRMESAGLVERRTDEADSRVTRVSLTQEGRACAARLRDSLAAMLDVSMGSMTEADKLEFTRILEAANDHIEAVLEGRGARPYGHPGRGEQDCR